MKRFRDATTKVFITSGKKLLFLFAVGPLDVKILGASQPLSAGRRYDLLCQSSGSRPPATITWWKNGQRLERTKETVREKPLYSENLSFQCTQCSSCSSRWRRRTVGKLELQLGGTKRGKERRYTYKSFYLVFLFGFPSNLYRDFVLYRPLIREVGNSAIIFLGYS